MLKLLCLYFFITGLNVDVQFYETEIPVVIIPYVIVKPFKIYKPRDFPELERKNKDKHTGKLISLVTVKRSEGSQIV